MPEIRQVKRNVGEALRRLKIQTREKQDGDVDLSSLYPDRPGEPDCDFYLKTGRCGYGATCRFNHPSNLAKNSQVGGELPERDGEPDCGYFMKTGTCKYRSSCKFNHPPDRHGAGPVVFNNFGLPLRQEEKSCPHYMRTGECKFGTACKFNHPQLAYAGNALPVPGTVAGGPPGLIIIPSSALSYAGGIPSWPPHRDTYLFNPQSHGLGWDTYMVTPPSTTVNNLPERRDQPGCRHFMNTGSCKYGSDCKYNHPREKILQLATSTLGPLGLPFRPGQAICSYYRTHGSCKFGPTCKYDHPFLGYPYNYGMNYNTLYVPDPSSFPSPIIHSYETYPSMSPKLSDSVGKVDVQSKQRTNVQAAEESPEPAESLSHSLST